MVSARVPVQRRPHLGRSLSVLIGLTALGITACGNATASTARSDATDNSSVGRSDVTVPTSTRTTLTVTSAPADAEPLVPPTSTTVTAAVPVAELPVRSPAGAVPPVAEPTAQEVGLEPPSREPTASGLPGEVYQRLSGPFVQLFDQIDLRWGCHPVAGCHYGVWDEGANTMWLADWLLAEPSLLYDVVVHELAHAADSHRLDQQTRNDVYAQLQGPARGDELLADCVARAAGAAWTHYWDCPSDDLRRWSLQVLALG
jgi:hypothetical protein